MANKLHRPIINKLRALVQVNRTGIVYLSGPMTGHPDLNFPLFNWVAGELRRAGYTVLNPVDLNPDPKAVYEDCMRMDIAAVAASQILALLPGWEDSKGACRERSAALWFGLEVKDAADLLPKAKPPGVITVQDSDTGKLFRVDTGHRPAGHGFTSIDLMAAMCRDHAGS